MSKRTPIVVLGEPFATKKAISDKCDQIARIFQSERITDEDDIAFIHELCRLSHNSMHNRIAEKYCPIFIESRDGSDLAYSALYLGRRVPFNPRKALSPMNPKTRLSKAFRIAVSNDMAYAKAILSKRQGPVVCSRSGRVAEGKDLTVDHVQPKFRRIVDQFLDETGIDPSSVMVDFGQSKLTVEFWPPYQGLGKQFKIFHAEQIELYKAPEKHLQLLSKRDNASRG